MPCTITSASCTMSDIAQNNWEKIRKIIMQTCPCNEDPLTPHFYIVKLGFTGVYIIFFIFALKDRLWVIFAQNIDCGYTLEPPQ